MSVRYLKPIDNGSRHTVCLNREELWKGRPDKKLLIAKNSSGGRNNTGRITVRHRGGGHRKQYRIIDFKRNIRGIKGVVERIEYDPNRTAFIALIKYSNGVKNYILASTGIKVGDAVQAGSGVDVVNSNAMPLSEIPVGTSVHNIEMKVGGGGVIARSAGSFAKLLGMDGEYSILKLSSGEIRLLPSKCYASVGVVSNLDNKNLSVGKAGRSRWKGRRPSVRGVAMNPVDHPHGGGEGKTSGGRHPVTPWGVPTKGKKTRNRNKNSNKYIRR